MTDMRKSYSLHYQRPYTISSSSLRRMSFDPSRTINVLTFPHSEKHQLTEKAQNLINSIRQMEVALDDKKPEDDDYLAHSDLQVTYPLLACLQSLKDKQHALAKIHRERYEQVKSTSPSPNMQC